MTPERRIEALRIVAVGIVTLLYWRHTASKGTVTVVDVRDEDSVVAGHIPGALWSPLLSGARSIEQLRALAKPVVAYCS